MRTPRPADFDTKHPTQYTLEEIDLSGVEPIQPVPQPTPSQPSSEPTTIFNTVIPRHHDIMPPSNHDAMTPRYHETLIEHLRRSVKEFGKEAATHRFTLAEKRAIAEVVHRLNMQGLRTTENEITRIAINFLVYEFNQAEQSSLLLRVLQALKQ